MEQNLTAATLDLSQNQQNFLSLLKEQGKSPNTLKNYKTDLDLFNRFVQQKQGHLLLNDFNLSKVNEYGAFLDQKYTSDNSKRRRIQTLRLFFDYLVDKSVFNENPVRKLPTSPKFLDIPRPTPYEDVQKLWAHLCRESHSKNTFESLLAKRNQVIFLLIYGSGLKVSDLSQLQRSHIMQDGGSRVMVTPPKRDPYTVPLLPIFDRVYQDFTLHLEGVKKQSQIDFGEVLFNANPYKILSGGISARGLEIIFEDLRRKLTITLTPKSLRQACIFNWLHKGDKETLVKEWMGVAPSYGLKLYRQHMEKHHYGESFLEDTYFSEIENNLQ